MEAFFVPEELKTDHSWMWVEVRCAGLLQGLPGAGCAWDSADVHVGLRKEDLQWGGSAEAARGVLVSQLVELSESRLPWVPSNSTGLFQPLMLHQCPGILPAPVGRETLCLVLSKLLA